MIGVRIFGAFGLALLLAACDGSYATFVTSTDIGISADATTRDLHLGYARTELFAAPAYPDNGQAPATIGYLGSNLSVFTPRIKQLYATGDAADLVTRGDLSGTKPEVPPPLEGQRRPMVFGTGSNLGLQVGFAGGAPSKLKFGYNRSEVSIIPLRREPPSANAPDKYAPVLAAINMDQTVTTLPGTAVKLTQFFATGDAARNLARRDDIRGIFGAQAGIAVKQAAVDEAVAEMNTAAQTKNDAIRAYFDKFTAPQFATARNALLDNSGLPPSNPKMSEMKNINDKDKFMKYLDMNPGVMALLSLRIPKAS